MSDLHEASDYFSSSLRDAVKLRLSSDNQRSGVHHSAVIFKHFRSYFEKYYERPALAFQTGVSSGEKSSEGWKYITYGQYARNVRQTALMLLHLGVERHSSVGILANNCPEWFYIELATLRIGGVIIGLYPSSSPEAVHHILSTADVSVCFVDSSAQMAKLREVKSRLPKLQTIVQLNGDDKEFVAQDASNSAKLDINSPFRSYSWLELFENVYEPQLCNELILRESNLAANDCAMLIFTSGTMGMPKGVMLTHDAVTYETNTVLELLAPKTHYGFEVFISYLPLNHIVAQIFDVFLGLAMGACIYFPHNDVMRGGLVDALRSVRPTFLFGVPRIFEKLEAYLNYSMTQATSWSNRYHLPLSRRVMLNYHLQKIKDFKSCVKYWFALIDIVPLLLAFGLVRCKYLFVGGTPVSEELKRFFLSINLPLTEVFGMSETSGAVTLNFDYSNLKVVGKPIGDMKIRINNPTDKGEGEICLYGRTLFMGYIKEPAKTAETFTADGWLRTGDWGYLDEEGNLAISGRIKDLIITSGGENIPALRIENTVKQELPCISNALLIGDKRKYLTILLTFKMKVGGEEGRILDEFADETNDWLQSIGVSLKRPSEIFSNQHSAEGEGVENVILAAIWRGIEGANAKALSRAQRIQYFTVLSSDFSTAGGELGDTLKIKRQFIMRKYEHIIEQMYKPGFSNKFLSK